MSNYNFYSQILESDAEYWCVAKEVTSRQFFEDKRESDEILFISLPSEIKTGQTKDEIKFVDVDAIKSMHITCSVHLSGIYTPFQVGQTFYSIYKGFPVKTNIREFFEEAMKLKSKDLWNYEKLYKEINENSHEPNRHPPHQRLT